ncbi:putative bifunctional diguanylate cyclase/phosphodiesterase [Antrihabitans stalactiti]|uniref:EAL domain-containing protein n=1 Tax=Antrihabitans stalactiti TaxID=2584121 RepID=A0A848KL85_9NOCA|nr:EAL domain-containing protein [Antrihabitans stalactiti]NMN98941.1 EAL domain-containing protein [Antrihabitans stalactiti]
MAEADNRHLAELICGAFARASTEAVVVGDPSGLIVELNSAAADMFGYAREELLGRPVDVLFPPALLERQTAALSRLRETRTPRVQGRRFTMTGLRSDGEMLPLEVSMSETDADDPALGGGYVVAFARSRMESSGAPAIADSDSWETFESVTAILESAPVLVFAVDTAGIIRVSTGGVLKDLGFQPGQLIGESIHTVYADRPDIYANNMRALSGEEFRVRVAIGPHIYDTQYRPLFTAGGALKGSLGITTDVTAQVVSEQALRMLAETDAVTGLGSRGQIEQELAAAFDSGGPLTLLLVDLDDFKDINDSHGHLVGDVVLRRIGGRMRRIVGSTAILGRLGGDELIVGLHSDDLLEVSSIADKILGEISRPMRIEVDAGEQMTELDVSITASIGIAVAPMDGDSPSSLLTHADSAMYAAKRSGRASHRFYRADADRAGRRLQVSTRLRSAIKSGALDVEFQPICRLADGKVAGFEALARWNDARLGPVSPDEFIALAESSPLIDDLFDLVLHRSLEAAAAWNAGRGSSADFVSININVAARQLRDPGLPDQIIRAADAVGLPYGCVAIELTETAVMENAARTWGVLRAISGAGIRVLIDDYGVGYSNMARLGELSGAGILEGIKIDRTFVADLPTDRAKTLLTMFLTMTRSLGVSAVAEGIESDEQLRTLLGLGCVIGQGWHFAKPMSRDSAVQLILDGGMIK